MKLAVIIGCPRSGTSILGQLLKQHPDVDYRFEDMDCCKKMDGINDSHKYEITNGNVILLRKWYGNFCKPGRFFVHKESIPTINMALMHNALPDAKFIHIIRDGRDVACSLIPGLNERGWMHTKPPSWKTIRKRHSGVMRGAHAWKEMMEIALDELHSEEIPHMQVKYETLVFNPRNTAKKLLEYLGLGESENVMEFCEKVQNEFEDSYHAPFQNGWYRKEYKHSVRIGRWKENLGPKEQKKVDELLRPLLDRFGYG